MRFTLCSLLATVALVLGSALPARAQAGAPETPWSIDVGIGWDNGISGNVHSSGIGTFSGLPTVIDERSWDDVYGTGLHLRIGAGYELSETTEIRGTFRYQSTGADVVQVGNVAGNPLFADFGDYQTWAIEGGYRAYFSEAVEKWRPYGEGTVGFAIIDGIEADFVVPASGLLVSNAEFYDSTTAFTFGIAGGVLYNITDRLAADVRLGLRYVGGLEEPAVLVGSGLEMINDDSARWTLPLTVGVRFRF